MGGFLHVEALSEEQKKRQSDKGQDDSEESWEAI
jgi:hypothetical protein